MTSKSMRLPTEFAALEPFVDQWAIEGTANRLQRRLTSQGSERVAFFAAAKDLLAPALEFLDRKPLAEFDEADKRLMNLVLAMCHVSLAVEIQGDAEPLHAEGAKHMKITRATADR